jgi:hypothetical protein
MKIVFTVFFLELPPPPPFLPVLLPRCHAPAVTVAHQMKSLDLLSISPPETGIAALSPSLPQAVTDEVNFPLPSILHRSAAPTNKTHRHPSPSPPGHLNHLAAHPCHR